MKTKHELIVKGWILCQIARILYVERQRHPLRSIARHVINEEITLIDWEVREIAKLTGVKCIV